MQTCSRNHTEDLRLAAKRAPKQRSLGPYELPYAVCYLIYQRPLYATLVCDICKEACQHAPLNIALLVDNKKARDLIAPQYISRVSENIGFSSILSKVLFSFLQQQPSTIASLILASIDRRQLAPSFIYIPPALVLCLPCRAIWDFVIILMPRTCSALRPSRELNLVHHHSTRRPLLDVGLVRFCMSHQ
ncbi:hypothetical protein BDB00DRAFT_828746 [Zychaea mexicana]|uniref:uncharacterized protein n=1 Tax=Zychaea mexicana TaxID=64656 RepID=UPI0022FF18FB|nr:uncharacterized protein BDB00DRAFT_828746 [Zychaea mexicana]KAI9492372.1 hypothetical protein BDB00DRAFT_828746 [Zychaea mexicana]